MKAPYCCLVNESCPFVFVLLCFTHGMQCGTILYFHCTLAAGHWSMMPSSNFNVLKTVFPMSVMSYVNACVECCACDFCCCWLIFNTCFPRLCSSISAACLCHEWFIPLAFLYSPQWGVENWICPDSHTCTHTHTLCTNAGLILESFCAARVTSITHKLTLSSLCKK